MWHRVATGSGPRPHRGRRRPARLRRLGQAHAAPTTPRTPSERWRDDLVGLMARAGLRARSTSSATTAARGSTHRMALDHPGAVQRAAVLDIVPTRHVFGHVDRSLAEAYYHWFFLSSPADLPEHLIGADPGRWVRDKLARGGVRDRGLRRRRGRRLRRGVPRYGLRRRHLRGLPRRRHGRPRARRRRRRCRAARHLPLLALWGRDGFVGRRYDVLEVWRGYADDVRGAAVPGGHFLPEEAPGRDARGPGRLPALTAGQSR